jgi:AcrR family transcriptional regulator
VTPKRVVLSPDLRRQQLLEAAVWVFARNGYRHASITDIIERAGVARGTFYLYFEGKEQIFLAIVEGLYKRVQQALKAVEGTPAVPTNDGPRGLLQLSFRQWLGFYAAHRDLTMVILREASSIDPRFEKGFSELRRLAVEHFAARLQHLQKLGLIRRSLSPPFVAHLWLGMFDEVLNAFVLKDANADLDDLARQLADFAWGGIRPAHEEA